MPITPREFLRRGGLLGLCRSLELTPAEVLAAGIESGALPKWMAPRTDQLLQLAGMTGVSHVQAARRLGVTRWTVAAWRQRLGLDLDDAAAAVEEG